MYLKNKACMKKSYLILFAIVLASFVSCIKENNGGNMYPEDYADLFDFSTSQEVKVSVDYPVAYGTPVELYTRNPLSLDEYKNYVKDATIEPIAKGYTDDKGHLSLTLRLASMNSEIYAYSPGASAPVLLGRPLDASRETSLTIADRIEPTTRVASRAIADTEAYWHRWNNQNFSLPAVPGWSWDASGKPAYLYQPPITLDTRMMKVIDNTIPKGQKLDLSYSQLESIDISEEAHVRIFFVSNGSARKNVLAYYTYMGSSPTQAEINRTAAVVFPNLSSEVLNPGDGVELKYYDGTAWHETFPAGSKIGFVMLIDAWQNGSITTTTKAVYSQKNCNAYSIPSENIVMANRPHMATFNAEGNFILSFEDLPYYESPNSVYPGDFRDDIFVLTADPVTALPDVEDGIVDPDKPEGIEIKSKGILAFEDLWPYKGDYDLNDIVLKYNSTAYMDLNMDIDGIVTDWTFCHNGGKYVNGFGMAFDFPTSAVKSFKVEATNNVQVAGAEEAGENFQLMLFHDATTVPSGTVFTVTLKLEKGAVDAFFGMKKATAPFNPFITVRTKDEAFTTVPRKEVHLTNYQPSPLAISFGNPYGDDLTNPSLGLYYVAATGYPFAIDLAGIDDFAFPQEMQRISDAYPRFNTWVESDGKEDKDWYVK